MRLTRLFVHRSRDVQTATARHDATPRCQFLALQDHPPARIDWCQKGGMPRCGTKAIRAKRLGTHRHEHVIPYSSPNHRAQPTAAASKLLMIHLDQVNTPRTRHASPLTAHPPVPHTAAVLTMRAPVSPAAMRTQDCTMSTRERSRSRYRHPAHTRAGPRLRHGRRSTRRRPSKCRPRLRGCSASQTAVHLHHIHACIINIVKTRSAATRSHGRHLRTPPPTWHGEPTAAIRPRSVAPVE